MLRQVLTPAELAELGLDEAVQNPPQAEAKLTFGLYTLARQYVFFVCFLAWVIPIVCYLSCYLRRGFPYTSSIGFWGGYFLLLLGLLAFEIRIGVILRKSVVLGGWDVVALFLGLLSRLSGFMDMLLPLYAFEHDCTTAALMSGVTYAIAYVIVGSIHQARLLISLYSPHDDYMVHKPEKLFRLETGSSSQSPQSCLLYLFLSMWLRKNKEKMKTPFTFLTERTTEGEGTGTIELHDNMEKSQGSTSTLKPKAEPQSDLCLPTKPECKPTAKPSSNDFNDTEINPTDHSTNEDGYGLRHFWEPPSIGDDLIYTFQYIVSIHFFHVLIRFNNWRNVSHRPGQSSLGARQQIRLLSPLNPTSSTSEHLSHHLSSTMTTMYDWLNNYKEQVETTVGDTKITQLVNCANLLDLFYLQHIIRSKYLDPDCVEAHEFSVAFAALSRCFLSDMILILFKFYLLSAIGHSIYIVSTISLSIFLSIVMCLYNTIDDDLWQEFISIS